MGTFACWVELFQLAEPFYMGYYNEIIANVISQEVQTVLVTNYEELQTVLFNKLDCECQISNTAVFRLCNAGYSFCYSVIHLCNAGYSFCYSFSYVMQDIHLFILLFIYVMQDIHFVIHLAM